MLKHKNCDNVAFQIMAKAFVGGPSEHWSGFWWTIGTTGLYRTLHDTFFVRADQVKDWVEYEIPAELELLR